MRKPGTPVRRLTALVVLVAAFTPQLAAYEQEIARLASAMAEKISRTGKTRVAVVDFTDLQGRVTELGRFLAEEFSVALAGSDRGFRVVDRTHLRSILEEHKLAATGLIDPATARQLGKIAGVEALVTATLTPFGDSIRLSIKVLDTESADVIDAATGNIAKTEAISELLGSTVASPGHTTPSSSAPRTSGSVQQTLDLGGVRFELLGCKRSAQQVKCEFMITMLERDDTLVMSAGTCSNPRSRAFDSSGNEFAATAAHLGTERTSCALTHQMLLGVPLRAAWVIDGVPSEVSMLSAIDFAFHAWTATHKRLQLRNIPILK